MMHVEIDISHLLRLQSELGIRANEVVQKLAQDTEGYIKNSFSAQSPSAPGDPPGVDTGNLKNSVVAEPHPADKLTWFVNIGATYADDLEFGTVKMAARPYVRPAVRWIVQNAPRDLMIKFVE